jgi:hypothetical protein
MRRFAIVFFLALAFAPEAFAQPEILAMTEDFVAGTWKFSLPAWQRRGPAVQFGPARDVFCRLDGATGRVRARCLEQAGTGVVTRDGKRIRIAWGGRMRGAGLDVALDSLHHVRGTYVVRLLGLEWTAPAAGTRRPHRENVPDGGGKAALLGDILRGHGVPKDAVLPAAGELKALGPLQRVIYMGREGGAEVSSAEFFSGRRLCAIRQRPDGVFERLRCI